MIKSIQKFVAIFFLVLMISTFIGERFNLISDKTVTYCTVLIIFSMGVFSLIEAISMIYYKTGNIISIILYISIAFCLFVMTYILIPGKSFTLKELLTIIQLTFIPLFIIAAVIFLSVVRKI